MESTTENCIMTCMQRLHLAPAEPPTEQSWMGSMFETGSSYLSTAWTATKFAAANMPTTGWVILSFFLLMLALNLRPRRITKIVNNYSSRGDADD